MNISVLDSPKPGRRVSKKPTYLAEYEDFSDEGDDALSQIDEDDFDKDFDPRKTQAETGKYTPMHEIRCFNLSI